ncbi:MAG: prepilin peptidase [Candidatus Bathyarchaeota archaeon]|nr:MAG: prepilin peptidase [Candidatus Bathyarchaeota archaeon]
MKYEVDPLNQLDAVRILFSLTMLGYTSWVDVKTREIYDLVWLVFGGLGVIIAFYEVYAGSLSLAGFILPVLVSVAASITLGYLGLFGGADVEAIIALSILHPFPPRGLKPALGIVSIIYPLTLFSNSALSGAMFALILLGRNLVSLGRGRPLFEGLGSEPVWKRFVVMVTGLKIPLESVRGPPFQYPLEIPDGENDATRRLVLMPDIQNDESALEMFRHLQEGGVKEVWVSHTLPFLVFITIGYILAILLGDLALSLLAKGPLSSMLTGLSV